MEFGKIFMAWTPDLSGADGPIYLALAETITRAVASGDLPEGSQLPSHRELAKSLGVDVTTVTRAYAEVKRAGIIDSDRGRGSFVRRKRSARPEPFKVTLENVGGIQPPSASGDVFQLEAAGLNMPPEPPGGILQDAIAAALPALLGHPGYLPLNYQPSGGIAYDRAARAQMMQGIAPTNPDQVVITAGGQNALHALCTTLIKPGDRIAAGRFTYRGFLAVARRVGAEIAPIEMDAEGLIPEAIEEAARYRPFKLLFVVPTNDNPTTATMGKERRKAVAELAERYNFIIIEDDAYGALSDYRLPTISQFAPTRTWYLSSLSKAVAPGFRVATVRAPSVREAFELASDIRETAVMAPPLNVALITQWILEGTLPRLIAAVRAEAQARQAIALEVLGPGRFVSQPEGYHLWLQRPDGVDNAQTNGAAVAAGLPVVPASVFAVDPTGLEQSLRICLGGMRSRERLRSDLERLDALLARSDRRQSS
jgi:DNA-binding transcriptional MocR family regulator